jgi:hypothetical protein
MFVTSTIRTCGRKLTGNRSLSSLLTGRSSSFVGKVTSLVPPPSYAPPVTVSVVTGRRWKSAEPTYYDDYHDTPSEAELRKDLAIAHRLTARYGMDMLTWNHISARLSEDTDGCLITPGNKLFQDIRPEDLLVSSTNITADIIHAAVYAARPDIQAIIHVHTPAATAISCLQEGFIPYTQE